MCHQPGIKSESHTGENRCDWPRSQSTGTGVPTKGNWSHPAVNQGPKYKARSWEEIHFPTSNESLARYLKEEVQRCLKWLQEEVSMKYLWNLQSMDMRSSKSTSQGGIFRPPNLDLLPTPTCPQPINSSWSQNFLPVALLKGSKSLHASLYLSSWCFLSWQCALPLLSLV